MLQTNMAKETKKGFYLIKLNFFSSPIALYPFWMLAINMEIRILLAACVNNWIDDRPNRQTLSIQELNIKLVDN